MRFKAEMMFGLEGGRCHAAVALGASARAAIC